MRVKDRSELQRLINSKGFTPSPAVSKYRNKKTVVDNITFDSAKEARRHSELVLMQKAGAIQCLERQKVFVLAQAVVLNGRVKPSLKYKSDFYYIRDGEEVVEDVKSPATATLPVFRIKQHLMMAVYGLPITLI